MTSPAEKRPTWIVVPCYNESRRLDTAEVDRFVEASPAVGLLFVDDGSSDSTRSVLEALAARHPGAVRCLPLDPNGGKAEAVRRGVLEAIGGGASAVGYWDADFATPLAIVGDFVAVLEGDRELVGVLGSRIQRLGARIERQWLRHYAGRLFATLASLVLGIGVYDTQCGAKLFRVGPEVERAFASPFSSRWIFDVELLARLGRELPPGHLVRRLHELPLRAWKDVAGSKLSTGHAALAFLDLLDIWRRYR